MAQEPIGPLVEPKDWLVVNEQRWLASLMLLRGGEGLQGLIDFLRADVHRLRWLLDEMDARGIRDITEADLPPGCTTELAKVGKRVEIAGLLREGLKANKEAGHERQEQAEKAPE